MAKSIKLNNDLYWVQTAVKGLTPQQITSIQFESFTSNIEAYCYKQNSMVEGYVVFKINSAMPAAVNGFTRVATSFPNAINLVQMAAVAVGGTKVGQTARVVVTVDGRFGFYWPGITPAVGDTYMCHFAYTTS